MNGVFMPIAWYDPTGAGNPIPCRWAGWLNGEWIELVAYGE